MTGTTQQVIRLRVEGPGEKQDCPWPKKVKGLETVWVLVRIHVDDIGLLKVKELIPQDHPNLSLWLPLRSLSLCPEARFRVYRGLVGDGDEWHVSGTGAELRLNSFEFLGAQVPRKTWVGDDWQREVYTAEWGHSLRCLDFLDEGTKQLVAANKPKEDSSWFRRPFEVVSRTFACAEPFRSSALHMRAYTEKDCLDWSIFEKYGWPAQPKNSRRPRYPCKPRKGAG